MCCRFYQNYSKSRVPKQGGQNIFMCLLHHTHHSEPFLIFLYIVKTPLALPPVFLPRKFGQRFPLGKRPFSFFLKHFYQNLSKLLQVLTTKIGGQNIFMLLLHDTHHSEPFSIFSCFTPWFFEKKFWAEVPLRKTAFQVFRLSVSRLV